MCLEINMIFFLSVVPFLIIFIQTILRLQCLYCSHSANLSSPLSAVILVSKRSEAVQLVSDGVSKLVSNSLGKPQLLYAWL